MVTGMVDEASTRAAARSNARKKEQAPWGALLMHPRSRHTVSWSSIRTSLVLQTLLSRFDWRKEECEEARIACSCTSPDSDSKDTVQMKGKSEDWMLLPRSQLV